MAKLVYQHRLWMKEDEEKNVVAATAETAHSVLYPAAPLHPLPEKYLQETNGVAWWSCSTTDLTVLASACGLLGMAD